MNFQNIFSEIEKVDPEVYDRFDSRRSIFKNFGTAGKALTIAAIPTVLSGLFQKAYGQSTPSTVIDVLQFALQLEYLEYHFYLRGTNSVQSPLVAIPAGELAGLDTIRDHENAHVTVLSNTIKALSPSTTPYATTAAGFDWTAKGAFVGTVFKDYATFLAVAQAFEDTGVRAYKGQAGNLVSNKAVLTAALNIHSVEARHAAHIRQMRSGAGAKPWITLKDTNGIPAVQPNYEGEQVTVQATVNIATLAGVGGAIGANAASEAFDEPLDKTTVFNLVKDFFI